MADTGRAASDMVGLQGQVRGLLESHIIGLAGGGRSRTRPGMVALRVLAPSTSARPALVVTKEAVCSMAAAGSPRRWRRAGSAA